MTRNSEHKNGSGSAPRTSRPSNYRPASVLSVPSSPATEVATKKSNLFAHLAPQSRSTNGMAATTSNPFHVPSVGHNQCDKSMPKQVDLFAHLRAEPATKANTPNEKITTAPDFGSFYARINSIAAAPISSQQAQPSSPLLKTGGADDTNNILSNLAAQQASRSQPPDSSSQSRGDYKDYKRRD